jgi:hypothetical protein
MGTRTSKRKNRFTNEYASLLWHTGTNTILTSCSLNRCSHHLVMKHDDQDFFVYSSSIGLFAHRTCDC